MSWVNLALIFAVLYSVATTSFAAWSAALGRPAEVLRFQ
jgi:ABC-type lipoprotein release transport system permease subunit